MASPTRISWCAYAGFKLVEAGKNGYVIAFDLVFDLEPLPHSPVCSAYTIQEMDQCKTAVSWCTGWLDSLCEAVGEESTKAWTNLEKELQAERHGNISAMGMFDVSSEEGKHSNCVCLSWLMYLHRTWKDGSYDSFHSPGTGAYQQ